LDLRIRLDERLESRTSSDFTRKRAGARTLWVCDFTGSGQKRALESTTAGVKIHGCGDVPEKGKIFRVPANPA